MINKHWDDLITMIDGKKLNYLSSGFIIDSPWIPGWYGISNIDYYTSDEHWINVNLKAIKLFPDSYFPARSALHTEQTIFQVFRIIFNN
jgi:hypothetical protein